MPNATILHPRWHVARVSHLFCSSRTVAVCHVEGYDPDLLFIILGSAVMLLATLLLSFWFYSSQRKATAIAEFRATAEAEKASLIIENAEKTAAQEREMTELMSHEVRVRMTRGVLVLSVCYSSTHVFSIRSSESLGRGDECK